jgi:hypothetical protein
LLLGWEVVVVRVELLEDLQRRAAAIRCRWLLRRQHVLLQRRIGNEGGFWLTISAAAIGRPPSDEALQSAMAAYTEVLAGGLSLGEAACLLAESTPIPH